MSDDAAAAGEFHADLRPPGTPGTPVEPAVLAAPLTNPYEDAPDAQTTTNVLDLLRDDVEEARAVRRDPIAIVPRMLPRYVVLLDPTVSSADMTQARKIAQGGAAPALPGQPDPEMDNSQFNAALLSAKCVGIKRDGRPLLDEAGRPLIFRHRWFMAAITHPKTRAPVTNAADACRYFWSPDGSYDADLEAAATALTLKSGWREGAHYADVDPTQPG